MCPLERHDSFLNSAGTGWSSFWAHVCVCVLIAGIPLGFLYVIVHFNSFVPPWTWLNSYLPSAPPGLALLVCFQMDIVV